MSSKISWFALIVALVALLVAFARPAEHNGTAPAQQETAFDRVMRTGTIRCGFATWAPEMVKDPNSGQLSGYDYDITMAVGRLLGLKVEWTEEVGWGVAEQGLNAHRYDMFCNGVWPSPTRTKSAFYSRPFIYNPVYAFVSANKAIPEPGSDWINRPETTIAQLPGAGLATFAEFKFPNAKKFDLSELAGDGDMMLAVTTGKADVGLSPYGSIKKFMDANPGQIQLVDSPILFASGAFLVPLGDYKLKHMIDSAISFLLESGTIRDILMKDLPDSQHEWRYPSVEHEL